MSDGKRRRRRSRKLLWGTLATCALLLVGALAWVLQRGGFDAEETLERATAAFEREEYQAAIIDLKNVVSAAPDRRDARYLLGRAYLAAGNPPGALKELNRARELGETAPTLNLELARAMLLSGKFDEAATEIALHGTSASVEWKILRGMLDLAQQRLEDARAIFNEVLAAEPDNSEARRGLMQVELAAGDPARARVAVEELLAAGAQDVEVLLIKGELDLFDGKLDDALAAFEQAAALEPDNPLVIMAVARTLLGQGHPDEASNRLERLGRESAEDPRANFLRARIADARGDPHSALLMLRRVLQVAPMHRESLNLAARLHFGLGEYTRAQDYVGRLLEIEPQNAAARRMQGAIQLAAGRLDGLTNLGDAQSKLEEAQDPGMLALLGTAYLKHGKYGDSAASLERAAELAPDSLPIRTQLALSRLSTGDYAQAIAELEAIRAEDPSYAHADVMLVLAHLANQDRDAALAVAEDMVGKQPTNAIAHNVLGYVQEMRGDTAAARAAYEAALGEDAAFQPARINLARLAIRGGDNAAGRARFQEVLEDEPFHTFALLGMAALALQDDQLDEAERLWLLAREHNPDAVAPRLLLAKHYRAKDNQPMAETLVKEAHRLAPYAPQVLYVYAGIMLAGRHHDAAREAAEALSERAPDSLPALELLARVYNQVGDEAALTATLERVAELAPEAVAARVLLGRLAIRRTDFAAATRIAEELVAVPETSAAGHELRGDASVARDDLEGARTAYERAFAIAPSGNVLLKLDQTERRLGRAGDRLERWLAEHPDDLQVRFARASHMQGTGAGRAAIPEYERMLATQGDNPILLNNLAWLYFENGDERALETARKAHELAPKAPEIMDTYGWILRAAGKREQAYELLQRAMAAAPRNPDIAYHAIAAQRDAGAVGKAREQLAALLAEHQDFPSRKEAEALLAELEE